MERLIIHMVKFPMWSKKSTQTGLKIAEEDRAFMVVVVP
jgi:hypothetical protein